ncbi:amino acid permease/ SLC12A domain-containing protein [Nemania sp. FL0031]|nr:amino acid permease/ SLC12A domain-containing protein [Nemania sp. FL0031]
MEIRTPSADGIDTDKRSASAVKVDDVTAVNDGAYGAEVADNGNVIDDGLQRGLKNRHVQMIAFGGVVGASIWYGSGSVVAYSGPVGALISFIIIGVDVFFVMQSLGEMSTLFPVQGAFIELAGRFIDPAFGFSLGWNYWYQWVTNIANDYNNISLVLGFWATPVPSYGWILIFWALFQGTSLLGIVFYGEMEFWLAAWKLFTVLGGFLVAILVNTGAIGGEYIGFRYWRDPGVIANGINGFGKTFVLAAVYYSGTEMLAMTAAESKNPKKDLPSAIRQTFWRILIIFIGLVFFAGIIVPSNSPDLLTATSKTALSPWTIALVNAGWGGAGNLVNVVMITAQFSSVNSAIYVASRSLVALAHQGRAPRFFAKTTKNGVPVRAIVFSNTLGLIALLNIASSPGKVFGYLVSISGAATFVAWAFIGITHLRIRKAWALQGYSADDLPYRALFYPYGTWFVVLLNIFLVFISGYSVFIGGFAAVDFVFDYIVIVIFTLLYLFWKFFKGTKMVSLKEADLVTGRREYLVRSSTPSDGEVTEKASRAPWYIIIKRLLTG